jgi:hypothetical protein
MYLHAFGRYFETGKTDKSNPKATSFSTSSDRRWYQSRLLRGAAIVAGVLVATNGEPSKIPGFVRGLVSHPQLAVDSIANSSGCSRDDYPSFTLWPPTQAVRNTFHSLMLGGKCLVTGHSSDAPQPAEKIPAGK